MNVNEGCKIETITDGTCRR